MADWQDIDHELANWPQPAKLWWRDDDAIEDTPTLQAIIGYTEKYAIPLHLAVIPAYLKPSLVDIVTASQQVYVMQHGISHRNHARPGQRKIEMGGLHSPEALQQQLAVNRQRLMTKFQHRYLDILVPPWNRIEDEIRRLLPAIGYQKLSALGSPHPDAVIPEVNVHIDIINWKQHCFAGETQVLDTLLNHLQRRRLDGTFNAEPVGLMTHHLQHDQACNEFLGHFFASSAAHPQLQWIGGTIL